jgi:3-oxoacyl-[acyl-carrier protein] reductase
MTKLAIITGASSGIGAACARQFREQGFTVINVSRRECPVDGVVNICGDLGEVTSANALGQRLVEAIEQHTPTSVCVVHNAALMLKDSVTDTTDSNLERVMQINVVAINALNRHLLPLLPTSSSLLFIGSTLSEKAVAGAFSYVVSKHAQLGMMRATCQDLMGKGIHTALIGPGFTDTEMLRGHVGHNQEIIAAISELNSFGRLVDPQEIASLVTWCHDNPVINGSVLHANLGQVEN